MPARPSWHIRLFQFATVLAGDAERAKSAVFEVLESSVAGRLAGADPERLVTHQFQQVRRRLIKGAATRTGGKPAAGFPEREAMKPLADAPGDRVLAAMHALSEPGRSALALLSLDALEGDEVARLLDLKREQLGDVVQEARLALLKGLSA